EGYVMATKPHDAITLRKYIVEHIGDYKVYLGAKGDGSVLRWVRTDDHISNTDDLWKPNHPGSRVTTSDCLLMMSHESYLNDNPTQPFYSTRCTTPRYTLCEYLI
ncbi:unnamed protein product, partial [Meganyctiphanes norvegica]